MTDPLPRLPAGGQPARPGVGSGPGEARLVVLSGPSGVGKGTVVAALRRRHPGIAISVSVTTRAPRPGEIEGVHYHFVSPQRFAELVAAGELLEHAHYAGHDYGTPRATVLAQLRAGRPVLLEIDLQGAEMVRAAAPAALLVFLAPPSRAELCRRLLGRGTEDAAARAERLARAEVELAAASRFDAHIVNDDVDAAADRLVSLICGGTVPAQ